MLLAGYNVDAPLHIITRHDHYISAFDSNIVGAFWLRKIFFNGRLDLFNGEQEWFLGDLDCRYVSLVYTILTLNKTKRRSGREVTGICITLKVTVGFSDTDFYVGEDSLLITA